MASSRVRIDVVGLIVLVLLGITGSVHASRLFTGFSSEAVILIATMLAFGEAIVASGANTHLARFLARRTSGKQRRLVMLMMAMASLPAMLVSDVGLVAMFIPVVKELHTRLHIPVRQLLLPLAVAATLGGYLTMVSSTANIIGNTSLATAKLPTLPIFALIPYGLISLAAAIAFAAVFSARLIDPGVPGRAPLETEAAPLRRYISELSLEPNSPFVGKTLEQCTAFSQYGITVVRVVRGHHSHEATHHLGLEGGDVLLVLGDVAALLSPDHADFGLRTIAQASAAAADGDAAELLVSYRSPWARRTIVDLNIRRHYGVSVLGLYREGHLVHQRLAHIPLRVGDVLLVQGTPEAVDLVRQHGFLVPLDPPRDPEHAPSRTALWIPPVLMMAALTAAALHLLSIEVAVVSALLGAIVLGLLDVGRAYRAIEWRIIVFVAGMNPLGSAMVHSGITGDMARGLESVAALVPSHWFLIPLLFLVASLLTQVVSNIATVLVLAPIAIELARSLQVHPDPLVVAILSAVAASPMTPLSNKQTLLVMGPGGYSYGDFLRFGIPLTLVMMSLATLLIPRFFRF